ncbi:MAG: type II toxin-antitoxin system HicB family antitoxin [bacterium]|jgi:predicted RNase H-like HicB family nuclease
MEVKYILSDYLEKAMEQAIYDKLEDGTFVGIIPVCTGLIAFGNTLIETQTQLRSVLEEWVLLGLKMGHELPVISGIDLNKKPVYESLEAL